MHRLNSGKVAYFDYAATTPTDPRVVEAMMPYMSADGIYGNASSIQHSYGTEAADAVELARKKVALLVKARVNEIIWVSGATEANNLAIQGVLKSPAKQTKRLVTVCTEHNAVLDVAQAMRKEGYETIVLPVNSKGILDINQLRDSIIPKKTLVSVMWVNNETGVIQPIDQISRVCKEKEALLHVDAAQAIGRININLRKTDLDLVSLSAHKAYGPKGVGVLMVKRGTMLHPLMWGGGQEKKMRAGTLPVPLIVGMGKACEILGKEWKQQFKDISNWHEQIVSTIQNLNGKINGDYESKIPHILNASFPKIYGNLIEILEGIAVSSAAACSTTKVVTSHVLRGMGLSKEIAINSLRISFGRFTTKHDIEILQHELSNKIPQLMTK